MEASVVGELKSVNKTSVLFVCLGNICRSPAAEGVFLDLIAKKGLFDNYKVDSAGTSGHHQGELADARMRQTASARGLELLSRSRQFVAQDFKKFDYIIVMDDSNYQNVMNLDTHDEYVQKVIKLTDFCDQNYSEFDHVPDPYYGGEEGFELVLNLLDNGCLNLLNYLEEKRA